MGRRATQNPLLVVILNGDEPTARAIIDSDPPALYRLRSEEPAIVLRAAELGRIGGIRLAVELGFDINAMEARNALHHAAAGGNLAVAQVLVELGADLHTKDPTWNLTPEGWARHSPRTR